MGLYKYKTKLVNSTDEIVSICENARIKGEKIVFTNGCFDIIHSGHISYLRSSRELGDLLIVGVNSDSSVKALKGKRRPINSVVDRVCVLEAMEFVNYIVIFDDLTPLSLIDSIKPDVYTKGGDYDLNNVIGPNLGSEIINSYGGVVKLIPIYDDNSTSKIISKLRSSL